MAKRGKKFDAAAAKIDRNQRYNCADAVQLVVDNTFAKFDETVDLAVRLGVDPRHADQMVRGTVVLPNGLGKDVKVLVFAKGEKEQEAVMRVPISWAMKILSKRFRKKAGSVLTRLWPHRM